MTEVDKTAPAAYSKGVERYARHLAVFERKKYVKEGRTPEQKKLSPCPGAARAARRRATGPAWRNP